MMPWEKPKIFSWDRPVGNDTPKLAFASGGRIWIRTISDQDDHHGYTYWHPTDPVPGARVVFTMEVYFTIFLVVSILENGHYNIHRTTDFQKFTMVHEHTSAIYGLFKVDEGHTVFSAEDGWYHTTNTGLDWTQLTSDGPKARAAVIVGDPEIVGIRTISAYGDDRKLYYLEYPEGSWEMVYDTQCTSFWYPAVDGAQVGLLAGAGNKLLISEDLGHIWTVKKTVDGIIRGVVASDKSAAPAFLIAVELPGTDGQAKLYWTYDLADSLIPDVHRLRPDTKAQSVFPTGQGTRQTYFAVFGKKQSGVPRKYTLIKRTSDY